MFVTVLLDVDSKRSWTGLIIRSSQTTLLRITILPTTDCHDLATPLTRKLAAGKGTQHAIWPAALTAPILISTVHGEPQPAAHQGSTLTRQARWRQLPPLTKTKPTTFTGVVARLSSMPASPVSTPDLVHCASLSATSFLNHSGLTKQIAPQLNEFEMPRTSSISMR